jgi:hypothetical protein
MYELLLGGDNLILKSLYSITRERGGGGYLLHPPLIITLLPVFASFHKGYIDVTRGIRIA